MFELILTEVHVRDSTNIPVGDIAIEDISVIKHCARCISVEIKSAMQWKQKEFQCVKK